MSEEQNKLIIEEQINKKLTDKKLIEDKIATDALHKNLPKIKPKKGKFPGPNILDRMDGL